MGMFGGYLGTPGVTTASVGNGDIASGAVGSGHLQSGSVQGFFGTTRHIASGTVGVWDFGSGAVIAGAIGSGAVRSGNIGSGQIGSEHIADGTIIQVDIGSGAVLSGSIASGQVGNFHVASGQMQGLAGAGVPNLASGTVNANNLSSGSVLSGHVGSGNVWGLVGALPHIASGSFTGFELGSGSVVSGRVASGQLADFHFASGAKVDVSEWSLDDNQVTTEPISGSTPMAVAFNQSGLLQAAMAGVSGRMPAVGVVVSNYLSGATAVIYRFGRHYSTIYNFSGWINRPVYVGRSGQLSASGAPTSSGDVQQIMGVSITASGLMLQPGDALEEAVAGSGDIGSGAVTGQAFGGSFCIASGTIGTNDIGSGAIVSGHVASGQLGRFHIGSGLLAGFELGSGSIVSGRIASGQIGNFHVASGQIQGLAGAGVPNVASGTINGNNLSSGAVQSGHMGSGSVLGTALASGAVSRASLQAGGNPLVSGASTVPPVITQITSEVVSGNVAVYSDSSGQIGVAMASISGRWPAVGVAVGNALSGTVVPWVQMGSLQLTSGMADYSGYLGRRVWLGRSGQITTISGSWSSGGFASGDVGQPLGIIANSGAIHFNVIPVIWSGGPLGVAAGGTF